MFAFKFLTTNLLQREIVKKNFKNFLPNNNIKNQKEILSKIKPKKYEAKKLHIPKFLKPSYNFRFILILGQFLGRNITGQLFFRFFTPRKNRVKIPKNLLQN